MQQIISIWDYQTKVLMHLSFQAQLLFTLVYNLPKYMYIVGADASSARL